MPDVAAGRNDTSARMTPGAISRPSAAPPKQKKALHQQFPHDAAARGSQRQTQRGFPAAREPPSQIQVRNVHAGENQHDRGRPEKDEQRLLETSPQIGPPARRGDQGERRRRQRRC